MFVKPSLTKALLDNFVIKYFIFSVISERFYLFEWIYFYDRGRIKKYLHKISSLCHLSSRKLLFTGCWRALMDFLCVLIRIFYDILSLVNFLYTYHSLKRSTTKIFLYYHTQQTLVFKSHLSIFCLHLRDDDVGVRAKIFILPCMRYF